MRAPSHSTMRKSRSTKRLYAARRPTTERASRNSLQNLREDFFTKLARDLCAATEREFWGAGWPTPQRAMSRERGETTTIVAQVARFQLTRAKLSDKMKRPTEPCDCLGWPNPNQGGEPMVEAHNSVHLTKLRTRLNIAIAVIAQRAAIRETKAEMQRQGRKPQTIPHRDIVAAANVYLTEHREALIAEAKEVVERWRLEGFFGKRAQLSSDAQGGKA